MVSDQKFVNLMPISMQVQGGASAGEAESVWVKGRVQDVRARVSEEVHGPLALNRKPSTINPAN